ncbi:hypothetical protein FKP32DRAFT_1022597 [Trametes sanguinea]|nr:hypothetical protein FKP32DRAFT_1022597 [Trametes sanguinea]
MLLLAAYYLYQIAVVDRSSSHTTRVIECHLHQREMSGDWVPPTFKHNYFLVHIVDLPNAQHTKHLEAHSKQFMPLMHDGTLKTGGALLPPTAKTTDPDVLTKTVGAWMIIRAENIEKVWEIIKQDVFYTSGEVWDHDKITITPAYVVLPEVKFD